MMDFYRHSNVKGLTHKLVDYEMTLASHHSSILHLWRLLRMGRLGILLKNRS